MMQSADSGLAPAESGVSTGPASRAATRGEGSVGYWLFCAALVVALLLLRQPYRGVRHDALLYLGQTLAQLDPGWAARDLYFEYGSQDRFSLFSRLFEWPVALLGIHPAEMLVLTLGRLTSLLAVYWLASSLPPLRRWLAVAAVACFGHFFGGQAFSMLEPFVTARTLAEPLAMLAVIALLSNRKGWALLALLATGAAHPLIALPVGVVMWLYLLAEDRRWLAVVGLALPVFGLARLGVVPFDALLKIYDDDWWNVVAHVNGPAFVSLWNYRDATLTAFELLLLWFATRSSATPLARFARAACIASLALCATSFVAADLVHDVLLTQLQLWRVLWVSHLMFVIWLPSLVLDQWQRGSMGRLAAVTLCCVAPAIQGWAFYGWALAAWAGLALLASERNVKLDARTLRLAFAGTILMGLMANGQIAWDQAFQASTHVRGAAISHVASIPFLLPALTMPFFAAMWIGWHRGGAARAACSAGVAALFVISVVQFDQRTPWTKFVEATHETPPPFQSLIPADKTVFWEDGELAPIWFLLRRASFASPAQFSGVLFNRETAMAAPPRLQLMQPVTQLREKCNLLEGMTQQGLHFQDCDTSEADFFRICTGQPVHADFLVTHLQYSRMPLASWRFDAHDGSPPLTYYLHDCKTVK